MKLSTVTLPAAGSNALPAASLPDSAAPSAPAFAQAPGVSAPGTSPGQPSPSAEAARQAASQINAFLKSSSAAVEFAVDGKSDPVIVRVVDTETHQVIRQMPSEETLAISRALDRVAGLLLNQKV